MSTKNQKSKNLFNYQGSKAKKISFYFAIIMLVLFPLMMGTNTYYNITVFKYGVFIILSVVFVLAILISLLVSKQKQWKGLFSRPNLTQAAVIVYFIWCSISAILSTQENIFIGQSRYEGWLSMALYALIFLAVSYFGEYKNSVANGMSVAGIFMGLVALLQVLGSGIFFKGLKYNYWNTTFISTVGHQDCYAGIISIFIPLLFCAYVFSKKNTDKKFDFRSIYLIGIFLLTYTFLVTDVDSGKLGLAAAFVVAAPFLVDKKEYFARSLQAVSSLFFAAAFFLGTNRDPNVDTVFIGGKRFVAALLLAVILGFVGYLLGRNSKEFKLSQKQIRIIVIIAMLICILAALVFAYNYSGSQTLLNEISQVLHGELSDRAGSYRGYIWKSAVDIMKNHGLFGSGPGTFFNEFEPYNAGYQAYIPNTIVDFAHNDFLQIGVCVGIVGLIIYVVFVFSLIVFGIKCAIRNDSRESVILLSAAVGYLAHSFFSFSIAIVTPIFWVLAGLLVYECRK